MKETISIRSRTTRNTRSRKNSKVTPNRDVLAHRKHSGVERNFHRSRKCDNCITYISKGFKNPNFEKRANFVQRERDHCCIDVPDVTLPSRACPMKSYRRIVVGQRMVFINELPWAPFWTSTPAWWPKWGLNLGCLSFLVMDSQGEL